LADTDMTDAQRREHAHIVMEECDRVTARINQFLAFARPCEPQLDTVVIANLLDELAIILQPDLESRGLQLQSHVAPAAARLRGDCELLRQLVFNLLQNAIHFSPPGGVIEVAVEPRRGAQAVLRVADRGPGVPDDAIASLFTPYFTTRPEGTGLGLAIVRHIATLHNWTVSYRARPDAGALFEVNGIDVVE
jgi:signal transduction histidine kinase